MTAVLLADQHRPATFPDFRSVALARGSGASHISAGAASFSICACKGVLVVFGDPFSVLLREPCAVGNVLGQVPAVKANARDFSVGRKLVL